MAVRALVFDVFGTLLDWRTGIADTFRECGVPGDPEILADAWRARYRPILTEVNEHRRPWADFDELHRATLDDLLAEQGLPLDDDVRDRLVAGWHRLPAWPDVRAGLDELRHTHITSTLSNGHVALLVDLTRHADLRFDCVLSAELSRAYKPARAAYLTAANLLGVDPGELMLVAAHPWDLDGARAAGLRTAFVARPLEYGPGSTQHPDPGADLSAFDLPELAQLLRQTRNG
ncbi:MAG: haloacid dehalogenase type II [Mycobacterium sp.]|nr:haloacid dehalogenase type II [Mycobacterium sp.]